MNFVKLRYIFHVLGTIPILVIHYALTPFSWLYEKTDWALVGYKEFKRFVEKDFY